MGSTAMVRRTKHIGRVHAPSTPQTVPGEDPPCLKLKALRERAGLTAKVVAQFLASGENSVFRKGSPTTWYRYEAPTRMGTEPIPWHIAEAIMPLFVGRGHPRITAEEIVDISEARKLGTQAGVLQAFGASPSQLPQEIMHPVFRGDDSSVTMLYVRHRAERGVFMDKDTIAARSFGLSPIAHADDVRGEQFVVMITDGHAEPAYRRGSLVQCVAVDSVDLAQVVGKRVIVRIDNQDTGLSEVAVGVLKSAAGNRPQVTTLGGKELDGEVLGVVFARYAREW